MKIIGLDDGLKCTNICNDSEWHWKKNKVKRLLMEYLMHSVKDTGFPWQHVKRLSSF